MPDVKISDIGVQGLALDSIIELEDNLNVSGQNTIEALKDFLATFIGGQVGSTFADVPARDLAAATLKDREFVEVTDASADPEVTSGRAWYRFVTGTTFILIAKEDSFKTIPAPTTLVDSAAVAFNMNGKYFDCKRLDTVEAAITLTLSNVIEGANQILSVKKNIAGDVTITLAGGGLSFYGYNNAGYGVTPDVVLSGASGDVFDISFLARTATEIGVALGETGN